MEVPLATAYQDAPLLASCLRLPLHQEQSAGVSGGYQPKGGFRLGADVFHGGERLLFDAMSGEIGPTVKDTVERRNNGL